MGQLDCRKTLLYWRYAKTAKKVDMKRLKVVAWDFLNKASIQVGAHWGWVIVLFQFCNFAFHNRIKKIGVLPQRSRSTRRTKRMRVHSSLSSTKASSNLPRSGEQWRITCLFLWPSLVSIISWQFLTFVRLCFFFSLIASLQRREPEFKTEWWHGGFYHYNANVLNFLRAKISLVNWK